MLNSFVADIGSLLIGICFYKGKIKAACGPGLDGVQIFELPMAALTALLLCLVGGVVLEIGLEGGVVLWLSSLLPRKRRCTPSNPSSRQQTSRLKKQFPKPLVVIDGRNGKIERRES